MYIHLVHVHVNIPLLSRHALPTFGVYGSSIERCVSHNPSLVHLYQCQSYTLCILCSIYLTARGMYLHKYLYVKSLCQCLYVCLQVAAKQQALHYLAL